MHSIASVRSSSGAADYFASDNYYTPEENAEAGVWGGEGARALGLEGQVERDQFEGILNGRLPDGEMVGPIAGGLFACLDDPEAVDARRMRLQPGRAKRFNGLRVRSQRSQVPTLGADGACLCYPGVRLTTLPFRGF